MWILIIIASIAVLIIFLWQVSNIISVIYGTLYVKTNRDVILKALKLTDVKKDDVFFDLGCGNGDVVIEAAKLGAKARGFEISPYYYILSKLRTWQLKNIEIKFQNIKDVELRKADVIYVYLLPKLISQLDFSKMKESAKIISIGFPIKFKKSTYTARAIYVEKHAVFLYTKKSAA